MSQTRNPGGFRRLLYPVADHVEALMCRGSVETVTRPLIILGPPRSGTTLFYQAFADAFQASWFCNLVDRKSRWPCLATKLVHRQIADYQSDYSSQFGTTRGKAGPAEARRLWSKWFTYHYADESTRLEDIERCRRVVSYVSSVTCGPFITKNPDHCIRVRALNIAFPDAVFIRIKRAPIDVARSILNARKDYLGSYDKWFGVRPPEIPEDSALSVTDQALLQVAYLEQRVDSDFGTVVRHDHQLTIEYEAFCEEPRQQFQKVERLARSCGIELRPKAPTNMDFKKSAGKPLSGAMEASLRSSFDAGLLDSL